MSYTKGNSEVGRTDESVLNGGGYIYQKGLRRVKGQIREICIVSIRQDKDEEEEFFAIRNI